MNRRFFKNIVPSIFAALVYVITPSCSNEWDTHYDQGSYGLPTQTLWQTIESKAELSIFKEMLVKTGYDTIVNTMQAYTVWAPNNDALSGVDLNDMALVNRIVANHVARFTHPTSGVNTEAVYMLTRKFVTFAQEGDGYTFGDNALLQSDIAAVNGVLHVIGQYVPYYRNIWEYIVDQPGLDSLKAYLLENESVVFDPTLSKELGTNSAGKIVYDSVFVDANPVLNRIGAFKSEDSIYTAILPNNQAWAEAYNRISGYYKMSASAASGAMRKRRLTMSTLVRDLVFRGAITDAGSIGEIVSTTGNEFFQPSALFNGTTPTQLSNGYVYVSGQLTHPALLSWHKEIKIEAEADSGRTSTNAVLYKRSGEGYNLDVSQKKYLEVEAKPASAISKIAVVLPVPNTLAAKYNIYCVFLPDSVFNPEGFKPSKVNFYLSLTNKRNTSGDISDWQLVKNVPDNKVSATQVTKMLVAKDYTFPNCNILDRYNSEVTVHIKVESAVTQKETVAFTQDMRIDYIVLEPVE